MLCSVCLAIDMDEMDMLVILGFSPSQTGPLGCKYHPNFHELMRSAQQNCELCQLILDSFNRASEIWKGRETFFDEPLYCSIANPVIHNGAPNSDDGSDNKKVACSEFWVFWNTEGIVSPAAALGIYIERSCFYSVPLVASAETGSR